MKFLVLGLSLMALMVGLFYIGPPLMVKYNFDKSGSEFTLAQYKTYRDSLQAYLPRAREIYDGHFPPTDVYSRDKQVTTIQNLLPTLAFSFFIFLFNGDITNAYLGAQFVFSALIFILFYGLGLVMFRSRAWSLFFSLTAVLTSIPLRLPFYKWQGWSEFQAFFINGFFPLVRTQFDQLYLARIDEPLLTYPVYIAAILSFFIFWKRPTLASAVLSGFLGGLLAYTYFHHWVYWTIVIFSLFFYVLLFKGSGPVRIKHYFILSAVFFLVLIPYFVNYLNFSQSDTAQDFIFRLGITSGRQVGFTQDNIDDNFIYLLLALITYLVYWKKDRHTAALIMSLIGAMVVVWNIQLATGYLPVPHFFRRSISPVIFIVLFKLAYDLLIKKLWQNKPRAIKTVSAILLLPIIFMITKETANIVYIRCCLQQHIIDYYNFPDDVVTSWNWINSNLAPDPIIISPSTLTSFYLTTYTSTRPFLPTAFTTLLSMDEMETRYLLSHKLFQVDGAFMRLRMKGQVPAGCESYECFPDKGSNLNDSLGNLYGNFFSSKYGSFGYFPFHSSRVVSNEKNKTINTLLKRYTELNASWNFIDKDVSYVYYGPLEKHINIVNFSKDRKLALVYKNPLVEIYRVK